MTKERKQFEQWWDAEDDIPNDGPYTPDTPIQFAWAGWQAALAQPEQEPVAWEQFYPEFGKPKLAYLREMNMQGPPQRQPLTDDELSDIWFKQSTDWMEFARAIEAAHNIKEKNT